MAELDNSALINDLLSGLLLEEVEQNAPVEPKGLMSSKTGTNTSADAAAAEAELQPKSGRASITEFIQKLSAADTPNEGESGGTLGSVNYLTMDDMYRKYNTPLYKLGSLNRDRGSDEDAAALKVKRNTNFGDAYLDSLGAAMDKSDTNSKRESILSEGKASTLFDRKAAEDLAITFLEGLQDKYQEKRINPNVKSFPEQDSFAVTELDDAVVGGASDGKVDEGLISSNASDDPSEESTFGESLMSRPPYDKEAMLAINKPQGISNYIIQSLESPVVSGDSFSTETLTETLNSLTNNNAFTAAVLGNVDIETGGEGLVEEELFYKLKNAKVKFRNAEDVLKTLPKEVQTRLKKGRDTSEDRGIFGTALADENYDGGSAYKGRGLVQLTHLRNYRAMQNSLAEKGIIVDLVNKPALANDPKYALPIALTYLESRGLTPENAKELGPYKMSRMINSGEPTNDKIKRWNAVMSEMTGTDLADARLSNEKTAQKKAGVTDVDGIIGKESKRIFEEWLTSAGISFELSATPYDLVRLVNSN